MEEISSNYCLYESKSPIYVLILNVSLKFQRGISSCPLNFTFKSTGTQHIQNRTNYSSQDAQIPLILLTFLILLVHSLSLSYLRPQFPSTPCKHDPVSETYSVRNGHGLFTISLPCLFFTAVFYFSKLEKRQREIR